ncbi:MAG: glutamyl-tRNA reductase, partial [Chloroflexota bacterium]
LPAGIRNGVILSTCNRMEVYGVGENASSARRQVIAFLSRCQEVEASLFSPYLYAYEQAEAMRHLFRVASGVDSLVVGEDQVQGQVRQALNLALEAGTAGRSLAFLFRRAVEVGKRARSETLIGRYAVSVSRASILLAKELLGELKERTTLVISAGETGELTSKIALECGAGRILVTNRTLERAKTLANRLGGKAIPFHDLGIALTQADIVISSTSAPGFILGPEIVAGAMSERDGRPLLLIDLAIPRDIDPEVKEMANVFLYNID